MIRALQIFSSFIILSTWTWNALAFENRIAALFSSASKKSVSEQVYEINSLSQELFSQSPSVYRKAILGLETHWSHNPQLAQTLLTALQTNWERQFSAQYWRERRLIDASARYIPLLTAIHVLDESLEKRQENALRLSKEMFAEPMTTVTHPAPISILAHIPEISRMSPLSIDEILTEEQLRRTQSQLEALGITSAAGLFLLKNKTVISSASKVASRNPLKITPAGLLAAGLILGAVDGLYAWSNYQSLEHLEFEVVTAELALRQAPASGLAKEILINGLLTATKNYALKLILPIYQNNISSEANFSEKTQFAEDDHLGQQISSDLKIRYLKAQLADDSATIEEVSTFENVAFYNWRFFVESNLSNGKLVYLPTADADVEVETRKYWAELLESEEAYRETLDHYLNLRITRLEEKMQAQQRNKTYKTLFSRRGMNCSYEYYRNTWLSQLIQTKSSQPHLENIIRYYYGFYSSPLENDPFDLWLAQHLSPAYDPGVLTLNQSQKLNELFSAQASQLKSPALTSIQKTQQHWITELALGQPCGHPLALIEQSILVLKQQGPQGAIAIQELMRFSQGLESLLHL